MREFVFRIEETGLADEEGNVCFQGRCTGEEIVRCGECMYRISNDCKWDEYQAKERTLDSFCSFGKRKGDRNERRIYF